MNASVWSQNYSPHHEETVLWLYDNGCSLGRETGGTCLSLPPLESGNAVFYYKRHVKCECEKPHKDNFTNACYEYLCISDNRSRIVSSLGLVEQAGWRSSSCFLTSKHSSCAWRIFELNFWENLSKPLFLIWINRSVTHFAGHGLHGKQIDKRGQV